MSGDWIKIETCLPRKPEVIELARVLQQPEAAVLGRLLTLWCWADEQSLDGSNIKVTEPFVDRLCDCPGFAGALRQVGWLAGRDNALKLPNFDRHNGQTAKARALTKYRVQRLRNGGNVTGALPEKRREEKKEAYPPSPLPAEPEIGGIGNPPQPAPAPTVDAEHAAAYGRFQDHFSEAVVPGWPTVRRCLTGAWDKWAMKQPAATLDAFTVEIIRAAREWGLSQKKPEWATWTLEAYYDKHKGKVGATSIGSIYAAGNRQVEELKAQVASGQARPIGEFIKESKRKAVAP